MFPSALHYIETILNPEGLFNTLSGISASLDADGQPLFCSGNFGSVFKVRTAEGTKALKCFTRHQAGRLSAYQRIAEAIEPSRYIIEYKYLPDEIFVFGDDDNGQYYPVLTMEWVEGETLTKHIERAVVKGDTKRLRELSDKFDSMSEWLLEQTFAHNDLKPDNIMIRRESDQMVLIDYDGMFVESMTGEQAREFGTEPYQSPNRQTAPFDRNVDNYSIAYIRLALNLLAQNPQRYSSSNLVDFNSNELYQIESNHTIFGSKYQYLGSTFEGIMSYKNEERYGFVRSGGMQLTGAMFDKVMDFSDNGLAAVCLSSKWGYIDKNGNIVIALIYDSCTIFSDGIAAVKIGYKWGFIDAEGRAISRFAYDNAWSPRQGLALVCKSGKYGFVGLNGRVAISLKYDFAQNFTQEGVACVKQDDKYGYIDQRGRWWEKPVYDYAQSFRNGKAAVELNGREFFINFRK